MNITLTNKTINILLILFFLISIVFKANSSDYSDSIAQKERFSLSLYISSGASMLLNKYEGYKQEGIKKKDFFYYPSIKILWRTNTLLNIGIESSFLTLMKDEINSKQTDYGLTNFEARMSALPFSLFFDMVIWGFDIYAGFGISFIESNIEAFNDHSNSNIIVGNYIYGIAYNISLSDRLSIGLDSKVYFITNINKYIANLGLSISYSIFKW